MFFMSSTPMTNSTEQRDATMSENTEIAKVSTAEAIGQIAKGSGGVVSTIRGTDFASKRAVAKATVNATPLSDHLGKPIALVHFVLQSIELADDQTGEMNDATRIVLLDKDGTAYAATSNGLMKSLQNFVGILGEPADWPEPLNITVNQAGVKPRQYFTATIAD